MDNKKLLLVSVSVGLFLIVVVGASVLVFSPRGYSPAPEYGRAEIARVEETGGTETVFPGSAGAGKNADGRNPFESISDLPPPVPPFTTGARDEGAFQSNNYGYDTYIDDEYTYPPPQSAQNPQTPQNGAYERGAGRENRSGAASGNVIYVYGDNPPSAPRSGRPNAGAALPASGVETAYAQPERNAYAEYPPVPKTEVPPPEPEPKARVQSPPKKPVAEKKVEKTESVKPAPSPKKRQSDYWIQTGAFSSKNRADNAKDFLADKGMVAVVSNTSVNGKTVYRVRVGPYTSQSEADYWLSLIKAIDGMGASQVWKSPAKM